MSVDVAEPADRSCIFVFTGKSTDSMLRLGGSASWRLDPVHARRCSWLVAVCNSKATFAGADPRNEHGEGFMLARVSGVERDGDRWMVRFSAWAPIAVKNLWHQLGSPRNPVAYGDLRSVGIDPDAVDLRPAAAPEPEPHDEEAVAARDAVQSLKRAVADRYGVPVEAVQVTVKL